MSQIGQAKSLARSLPRKSRLVPEAHPRDGRNDIPALDFRPAVGIDILAVFAGA